MQEELSIMFSRNMGLSNTPAVEISLGPVSTAPEFSDHMSCESTPPSYSISQHYHHSAHLAAKPILADVSQTQNIELSFHTPNDAKEVLAQNGIDPSSLLPTQLTLFEQAALDQRTRLLELWHISPPDYTAYGAQELSDELGGWCHTTLEQEEEMARLRLQRKETRESATNTDMDSSTGKHMMTLNGLNQRDCQIVEPYMTSGYEMLAQKEYDQQAQPGLCTNDTYSPSESVTDGRYQHSTDPVFQGRGWWRHNSAGQPVEHQYGLFDQMNQFHDSPHISVGASGQEDEEML